MVTQNSANNKTGALGTVLQGQGVGTASDFSTATYPATTTINEILYSSATNTVTDLATANNGVLIASNTGVPSMLAAGTVDYVLTANTAAPPSWQESRGYILFMQAALGSPADATTYFLMMGTTLTNRTTSGAASSRMYIPVAGTITKAYGTTTNTGTLGSSTNTTIAIRLNNTTDTTISSTVKTNAASSAFSNTGLSITVAAGDYIEIKFTGPSWATNPTNVGVSVSIYIA